MDFLSSSSSSPFSSTHQRQACKRYHFVSEQQTISVKVLELLDADFGLYVWPSALVLSEFIFHRLDMFTGSIDNPKIILELGAGTALPSLLLAKATAPGSTVLITTDRPYAPHILDNIHRAYKENSISWTMDQDHDQQQRHRLMVRSLGWGDFTLMSPRNPDGGLLQLLKDVSGIEQVKEGRPSSPGKIDIILGSDTFYNPPDFEPLLATVSFIINRHNPDCVFLTTYQNRSAKRNIDHLLEKWGLEGRVIEWEAFDFDMSKFVNGGDTDGIKDESLTIPLKRVEQELELDQELDEDEEQESEKDDEGEDRWVRLAKEEIRRAMSTPEVELSKMPGLALVDYSSGSDHEEDAVSQIDDAGVDGKGSMPGSARESASVSDDGNGQENYSHKMGDGGSLSSVHFLWICKRGSGDNVFATWVRSRHQV
ncbi:Methyltransferase-like protein 23 [Linnemannia exigua]|uniref:Methyltransferase-like protein 23 n=1 Tax=Linnemannia exigua TaxID=604196 RepID=A0AAD4D6S0_9FUNG|nr:Methyltransferase-like protein 23 [Linnemannia exigua]